MTHQHTDEAEPERDTLQSAMIATARLWLGAALLNEDALDCVRNTLLDDARAAAQLESAGAWLLASASRLPAAMLTTKLLQLLSTSASLDVVN